MPLIGPTRAGWFEILERGVADAGATVSVSVYHPELTGRLAFERGRRTELRCAGQPSEAPEARLRGLGPGGYFEVWRRDEPAGDVVICAEPETIHVTACTDEERSEMLEALLERRFRAALAKYTQHCATCRSRPVCTTVKMVERNVSRLLVLTAPVGDDP